MSHTVDHSSANVSWDHIELLRMHMCVRAKHDGHTMNPLLLANITKGHIDWEISETGTIS